jgi:hypothetical protein
MYSTSWYKERLNFENILYTTILDLKCHGQLHLASAALHTAVPIRV